MAIKNMLIFLILLLPITGKSASWQLERGSYQNLLLELKEFSGVNEFFNCNILIENYLLDGEEKILVTILDNRNGQTAVLDFGEQDGETHDSTKVSGFHLIKEVQTPDNGKVLNLRIKKDFNGNWVEILYREYIERPFTVIKTTFCRGQD